MYNFMVTFLSVGLVLPLLTSSEFRILAEELFYVDVLLSSFFVLETVSLFLPPPTDHRLGSVFPSLFGLLSSSF